MENKVFFKICVSAFIKAEIEVNKNFPNDLKFEKIEIISNPFPDKTELYEVSGFFTPMEIFMLGKIVERYM